MQFVIGGIFVLIVAFLVWRSKKNTDPIDQACASEIGVAEGLAQYCVMHPTGD